MSSVRSREASEEGIRGIPGETVGGRPRVASPHKFHHLHSPNSKETGLKPWD